MAPSEGETGDSRVDAALVAKICWYYFKEGQTQDAIAQRLKMTRKRVNRILGDARESGFVQITIADPSGQRTELEEELIRKFNLRHAIVVPVPLGGTDVRSFIGAAAARYVAECLPPSGSLGITWGGTINAAAQNLPQRSGDGTRVVLMSGGLAESAPINPYDNATMIARALGARCYYLTAPMFAGGGAAFALAAAPMLLLIVAQREIVLRSKARFEERALEHAEKEKSKKSPMRRFAKISSRVRSKRPFEIDRRGPPEIALVWKNAMRVSRARWTRIAYAGAALLIGIALLPALLPVHDAVYGVLATFGAVQMVMLPLLAGMTWKNDLRTELAHIDLVRTWPVPARRFVMAEVLSPAILSFACAAFGAGVVLTSLFGSRLREALTGQHSRLVLLPRGGDFMGVDTVLATVLLFVSFLPMTAAVSFFSSALQNLATLFVPAWVAHGADRSQGVAAFGQRMLFSAGLGLALLLALIPSALLVGAAAGVQWLLGIPWSAWAFPLWGVLAAAPQLALGWLIVQVAGRLWERLDPSQEILELGR